MNRDLILITARIGKIESDCANSNSKFSTNEAFRNEALNLTNKAITDFINKNPWASSLQPLWDNCKAEISRVFQESPLENTKASSVAKVQDVISPIIATLKDEIAHINVELAKVGGGELSSQAAQPSVEPLSLEVITMSQQAALAAAEQKNKKMEEFPRKRPWLAKTTDSVAIRIDAGNYGEELKKVVSPYFISRELLLSLLLVEHLKKTPDDHTYNEPEWQIVEGAYQEAVNALKADIQRMPRETIGALLEEIFLRESDAALSEEAQNFFNLLKVATNNITITRSDEAMCGSFLQNTINISNGYRQVFLIADGISDSFVRARLLTDGIIELKSLNPELFFQAIDKALEALLQNTVNDEDHEECISSLSAYLYEELVNRPHIMESFSKESRLWRYLMEIYPTEEAIETIEDVSLSILLIPSLLSSDLPYALKLMEQVLEIADAEDYFVLPTELFRVLLRYNPEVAERASDHVWSQDEVQCKVQLLYNAKESGAELQSLIQKVQKCKECAVRFLIQEFFAYLDDDPTPDNARQIKIKINQLLRYLNKELKNSSLRDCVSPEFLADIEFSLLKSCLEQEESLEAQRKIKILLIPELARIGKKDEVAQIVQDLIEHMPKKDLKNKQNLLYAVLKAIGVQDEPLERLVFGTFSDLQNPRSMPLDDDLMKLYFEIIQSIPNITERGFELIRRAIRLDELSKTHRNLTYQDFSLQIAEHALNSVRIIRHFATDSMQSTVMQECFSFLQDFIEKLSHIFPQLVLEAKHELFELGKEHLVNISNPFEQIVYRINLFKVFAVVEGLGEESFQIAEEAFNLIVANSERQTENKKLLLDVLEQNLSILSQEQRNEAKALELKIKIFMFSTIQSIQEPTDRITYSIACAKKNARHSDLSLQITMDALEGIKALSDPQLKRELLFEFIEQLTEIVPEIIPEARDLLKREADGTAEGHQDKRSKS